MRKTIIIITALLLILNLTGQAFAFTLQDEVNVGREAAQKIEKQYKVLTDDQYQGRLIYVAKQLYRVCPRKEIPYTFKVIDTNVFNAFALPGGFIYVTRELMDKSNDGELAFVLGHEMAHCAHSHQFKQAEKQMGTSLGLLALAIILSKGSLTQGAMNTVAFADAVMNSSYSRADERQADVDSLSYMYGAGYDPMYAISSFEKMKKYGGSMPNLLNGLIGSHPLPDERIQYARERAAELGFRANPNNPYPQYGASIKGYGYKPSATVQDEVPVEQPQEEPGLRDQLIDQIGKARKSTTKKEPQPEKKISAEQAFENYRSIPFGNITRDELISAPNIANAEDNFYIFLKTQCGLTGAMERSRKLDNRARYYSTKLTPRSIGFNYVIFSDILPANLGYFDFEDRFYKYDLPYLQLLNKDFDKVGVSIKYLPDGRKYIVVLFEYK
ncbi:MAG: M48 family metalloprotease [Armatimonadota bacterium]